MFEFLQTNFSLLSTSLVLLFMAGASFFLALLLRTKSRALKTLPKDLPVQVFDKTFNIFDPNIKQRRIISNHTGLIIFIAIYGSWLAFVYIVFKTFEIGGTLAAIAMLICAALLMLDETQELNRKVGIFTKAINNGTGLANGDMQVLRLIRKTLPKLSTYHLILAIVFLASALALPLVVDAVFWASAGIAAALFQVTAAGFKVFSAYSLLIMVAATAATLVVALATASTVRKKIFGFPSPEHISMSHLALQSQRMQQYRSVAHHPTIRVPEPLDTEKMTDRDREEHPT
jgi:hypothetical protein